MHSKRSMYPMDVESGEGLAFIENEKLSEDGALVVLANLDEDELAAFIVPYLARRNYHIPGNSWFQDWFQYVFANNHPIFGLCCHYKHHPVSNGTRILVFFGTICASLAIFNIFYLYFLWKDGNVKEAASFQTNITIVQGSEYFTLTSVTFDNYEIALWTLGAFIHSLYDMSIWTIAACAICAPGGALEQYSDKRWLGKFLTLFIVLATAGIATLLVIIRASVDENDIQNINSGGLFDDTVNFERALDQAGYMYLRAWAIAFFLAVFVYNLIISTILFSGILGCGGDLPILGGRPYDVKQEQIKRAEAENKLRRKSRSRKSIVGVAPMEGSKSETSTITTTTSSKKTDAERAQRRASRKSVIKPSPESSRPSFDASLQLDASRRASRMSVSFQTQDAREQTLRRSSRRKSTSPKSLHREKEPSGSAREVTRNSTMRASKGKSERGNKPSSSMRGSTKLGSAREVTRNSTMRASKGKSERGNKPSSSMRGSTKLTSSSRDLRKSASVRGSTKATSSSRDLGKSSSQKTTPLKTSSTEHSPSKESKKKKKKSKKKKKDKKATMADRIVEEV
jgi:hypothetical protein